LLVLAISLRLNLEMPPSPQVQFVPVLIEVQIAKQDNMYVCFWYWGIKCENPESEVNAADDSQSQTLSRFIRETTEQLVCKISRQHLNPLQGG
jgi:hypothetical protein